jgi:hypothetical protein
LLLDARQLIRFQPERCDFIGRGFELFSERSFPGFGQIPFANNRLFEAALNARTD